MTANQYISIGLLLGRIICVSIMVLVIRKQWQVLWTKNYPELQPLRWRNLVGSIILIAMNFVPIIIDVMGVFNVGNFTILLMYVFSNNLTAILYSYMLWTSLKLAEKIVITDDGS